MLPRLLSLLRHFVTNVFLIAISVSLTLLAAEGFVRSWLPSPDYGTGKRPAIRNQLFMHDDLLGWKGTPNYRSRYLSKDFDVTVSHDALGYRNMFPPHVAGKRNILLLGDSYGWGWGVEDNETATAVLNQEYPQYNAYSLAAPGYGTDQQYLALQRHLETLPQHHYDDVVVLFYLNDFNDNIIDGNNLYPKPRFELNDNNKLELRNVPVPPMQLEPVSITEEPDPLTWLQKSQLLNFALNSIGSILFALSAEQEAAAPITLNEQDQRSQQITHRLLQEIARICAEKNMRFHVAFLITINTDEKPAMMIRQLASQLTSEGTPHSFIYSKTLPRTDLWLDTHYTPYGQERLADHLAEILKR